jgi:ABC-type polysaccharide/polyol phosphate export permease
VADRIPGSFFLRNLVERRALLGQLVRRDFEQRFVGSAMGWIWGLIHPLVLLASWTFVFGTLLGTTVPGVTNYPLYLFAGMLPWLLFSETVQRSASSLLEHSNLITKTVFPAEIVPISVFLSTLVSHALALALLVAAVGIGLGQISPFLALLPLYVLVIGLMAVGLGWIVSAVNLYARDTAQVLSVILTFWFWLTPIFVGEDRYRKRWWASYLLDSNPLAYVVRGYRAVLTGTGPPNPVDLAVAAAFGAAMFVIGGLFFRHMKRGFADVL